MTNWVADYVLTVSRAVVALISPSACFHSLMLPGQSGSTFLKDQKTIESSSLWNWHLFEAPSILGQHFKCLTSMIFAVLCFFKSGFIRMVPIPHTTHYHFLSTSPSSPALSFSPAIAVPPQPTASEITNTPPVFYWISIAFKLLSFGNMGEVVVALWRHKGV